MNENKSVDIAALDERLRALKMEVEISERHKSESAQKAASFLAKISDNDIALLAPIVPEIIGIRTLTAENIQGNKHGEVKALQDIMQKLSSYLDERLTYYENSL